MRYLFFTLILFGVLGCEFVKEDPTEPNDDMDSAYKIYPGQSVKAYISERDDKDYFLIPTDSLPVQGGVLIFSLEPFPMEPSLKIYNHDRVEVAYAYEPTEGANLHIWLAVKSGTFYYALVEAWGGWTEELSSKSYTFSVSYIEVPDPYEPNDNLSEATPIEIDSTYHPYMFAGEPSSLEDYADCFSFKTASGTLYVRVEDVPDDVAIEVHLYDANGAEIAYTYESTCGASITLTREVESGDYFIKVRPFLSLSWYGKGEDLPSHVTKPYTLKVTLK